MANHYRKTQQGKRGRKKGTKNLKKLPTGNLENQNGVIFSQEDKKALERAVNRANAKRRKMLQTEATLPRTVRGKSTGDTVGSRQAMGFETEFVLKKKSKSLQRFKSREEYEKYMDYLSEVNSPDYITKRARAYKRNFMKALEDEFGNDAKDIKMKVRMMKPEDFMKVIASDEDVDISFIYSDEARSGRLNQLRASFGMKLKEEEIEMM